MGDSQPGDTKDNIRRTQLALDSIDADELSEKIGTLPDSDQMISDQIRLIKQVDARKALERLTLVDFISAIVAQTDSRDDGIGLFDGLRGFLIGLIMAYGSNGGRDCTYEELTANIADLPFIYMLSDYPTINSDLPKNDDEQYAIGSSMVSREFNESRHSFLRQSFEASIRMYRPHNKYLERELGFTIEQAVRCLGHMEDILTKCRENLLRSKPINIDSVLTDRTTTEDYFSQINSANKVVFVTDSDKYARESRFIEEYYQYVSDKHTLLSLTQSVLLKRLPEDLPQSALTHFLERISIDVNDLGEDTPSGDRFRYPYQINPLHKYPLPQVDGRVFLPDSDAVRRSFRETFYYDLISLPDYGDPSGNSGGAFGDTFGDYLENWTHECMLRTFEEDQALKNPLYPDKNFNEACDLLVKGHDTLYVIECKIGKLPQQTQTGEIEAIRQSLEAKVIEAHEDQAMKFINQSPE